MLDLIGEAKLDNLKDNFGGAGQSKTFMNTSSKIIYSYLPPPPQSTNKHFFT